MKKRIEWIDCAKFVAIIGVLSDHTYILVYSNRMIAVASYAAVSLFVLIAGIVSYDSICRKSDDGGGKNCLQIKQGYNSSLPHRHSDLSRDCKEVF